MSEPCKHSKMTVQKQKHPQQENHLYCDDCNKVFDPQKLVDTLTYYATAKEDRQTPGAAVEFGCGCCVGFVHEEGFVDPDSSATGHRARQALGWK